MVRLIDYRDIEYMTKKQLIGLSLYRAVWGFIAFIPFCWLWGVDNFSWFAFIGTLYFVPVHWLFDKVMKDGRGTD